MSTFPVPPFPFFISILKRTAFTKLNDDSMLFLGSRIAKFLHDTNFFRKQKFPKKTRKAMDKIRQLKDVIQKYCSTDDDHFIMTSGDFYWFIQVALPLVYKYQLLDDADSLVEKELLTEEEYRLICNTMKESDENAKDLLITHNESEKSIVMSDDIYCTFVKYSYDFYEYAKSRRSTQE